MQTNNKPIIIILAAVLLAAFFMPWFTLLIGFSAWDVIFGGAGQYVDGSLKYVALLIPISAALIIYGAAFNNGNYALPKPLLFLLPILTLAGLTITLIAKADETGARFNGSDFNTLFSLLGIGFWLTLITSVILPFMRSQPVARTETAPARRVTYSQKSRIGIVLAIVGLALILVSTQNQLFKKEPQDRSDFGANSLQDLYSSMGSLFDPQSNVDTKKKNAVQYSGIAVLVIGIFLFASGRTTVPAATPPPAIIDEEVS